MSGKDGADGAEGQTRSSPLGTKSSHTPRSPGESQQKARREKHTEWRKTALTKGRKAGGTGLRTERYKEFILMQDQGALHSLMGIHCHTTIKVTGYTHTPCRKRDMPCHRPNLSLSFLLKSLHFRGFPGTGDATTEGPPAPVLARCSSSHVLRGLGPLLLLGTSAQAVPLLGSLSFLSSMKLSDLHSDVTSPTPSCPSTRPGRGWKVVPPP